MKTQQRFSLYVKYPILINVALFICLTPALVTAGSPKSDSVLHFESQKKDIQYLNFKDKDDLQPVASKFKIVEYSLMSNDKGDRWALITVQNTDSKKQKISDDNFVAVFADGERRHAKNFYELVEPNAKLTEAIFFGKSNFPVILITMDKLPD